VPVGTSHLSVLRLSTEPRTFSAAGKPRQLYVGGGANRLPALDKEVKQASRLKGRQMKRLGSERGIEKTEKDS
jgi:hypothetical protein